MTERQDGTDGAEGDARSWWGPAAVAGWFIVTGMGCFVAWRMGRQDLLRTPAPPIVAYLLVPYWALVGMVALLRHGWRSLRTHIGSRRGRPDRQ